MPSIADLTDAIVWLLERGIPRHLWPAQRLMVGRELSAVENLKLWPAWLHLPPP